ncbi:esterase-like activity of phytase family protein [Nitrosovibrio sp. Nv17]|uniref:esterase-like activity of phytase family protein n=1 Tax=Nitrosovibrio sp. Nv17 TaxID=1855339 RepID=UPI000908A145|nr:esterase-like activity of phytase family protein [Nitrosovibrio sp. Nv17]SFW19582.1 PEP-CTERM protein-sorting domain-containing protein [Nitrosovibrio sp. Nv17]
MKHAMSSLPRIAAAVLFTATTVATLPLHAAPLTVNGTTFELQGLVGVGRLPANLVDEHGETFGSVSGLFADTSAWTRSGDTYSGIFYTTPDRGYNAVGTIDYTARLNQLAVSFTPAPVGASGLPQNQIQLTLTQATKLYEALPGGGKLDISGLDPVPGGLAAGGARAATGLLPELPQAYNGKLALDAEGVVKLSDGSRLISDEYGPSIYRFSADGQFLGALPVAESVRPIRNGVTDYSSNNPAAGQPAPVPANPSFGRQNNQGFEGLSISPDGKTLFVGLQSATRQDGGTGGTAATRDNTRLFTYDLSNPDDITLTGEYVVQLPKFTQNGQTLVAAQSEIHALSDSQLLILPRDSNGFAVGTEQSFLRRVDVIDISDATNILGQSYEGTVAPGGVLDPQIIPALYAPFLDVNDNSQLNRFGLANGNIPGFDNLSEKWEGLALVSALDPEHPNDYFLIIANDNDFMTTQGFQAGEAYDAGVDIDTTFLAYRVTISPVPEPSAALMMLAGLAGILGALRTRRRGGSTHPALSSGYSGAA